jgi:hypothetical protein
MFSTNLKCQISRDNLYVRSIRGHDSLLSESLKLHCWNASYLSLSTLFLISIANEPLLSSWQFDRFLNFSLVASETLEVKGLCFLKLTHLDIKDDVSTERRLSNSDGGHRLIKENWVLVRWSLYPH